MRRTLFLLFCPIFLFFCLSSCGYISFLGSSSNSNSDYMDGWSNSLRVDITVLWARTNFTGWAGNMIINGDIGVRELGGLQAIDLKTGTVLWTQLESGLNDPISYDGDIIAFWQNKVPFYRLGWNGSIKQKIWLSTNGILATNGYEKYFPFNVLTPHGNRLYWGTYYDDQAYGVVSIRLDNLIDAGDHTNFLAFPEVVSYRTNDYERKCRISGEIGFSDQANLLFYYHWDYSFHYAEVVAVDLTTWQRKWVHSISYPGSRFTYYGLSSYSNLLIIEDWGGISILDSSNGNELFYGADGNSSAGGTQFGHYYYSAAGSSCITNVYCIDLDTQKIVWSDSNPTYDFQINPIIHNGICYIVAGNGVLLYNALTGERLGWCYGKAYSSSSFYGNKILVYNGDTMIINSAGSSMFAVKMDFSLDTNGMLLKNGKLAWNTNASTNANTNVSTNTNANTNTNTNVSTNANTSTNTSTTNTNK